ncbi:hypothetical protein B6N60_02327 [Richelia sinica FACHB-800]|uniref:Uncharacterized protein n=1 Tax=Richelia sinica FACHB-800 TaxID=1357546 RepID=A0A975Y4X8_9NOST|nr:hypothetical protein [Richelia sinica]MBD2667467.1 hypothetical protein [Richelia sinica FACHB-800]QXE23637.1 hypothetical protein B6N60_02327 [Richelia sinica FACHB-800]
MLETLIPQLLEKSIEVILTLLLEKLLTWLLKDENIQRLNYFVKMQMLVLYLDWVLLKTPLAIFKDTENQ